MPACPACIGCMQRQDLQIANFSKQQSGVAAAMPALVQTVQSAGCLAPALILPCNQALLLLYRFS